MRNPIMKVQFRTLRAVAMPPCFALPLCHLDALLFLSFSTASAMILSMSSFFMLNVGC